jgi:Ca2+-transporting ATPase
MLAWRHGAVEKAVQVRGTSDALGFAFPHTVLAHTGYEPIAALQLPTLTEPWTHDSAQPAMSGRPEIVITTDLASTDNLVPAHRPEEPLPSPSPPAVPAFVPGHARTGSDPTLLSPILKTPGSAGGRPSFDASDDGHSAYAPASPTLSARSSVRFQQPTTLDLRSNQPTADSGVSSLALLSPGASAGASGHRRKLSNATFASNEGTVAEHDSTDPHAVKLSPLPSRPSDLASTVRSASPMTKGGAPVKAGASLAPDGDGGPDDGASARGALDLSADEGVDLGPFAFGPTRLASLVDPKSLDVLREMGGVEALLRGLATHRTLGLSDTEAHAEAPAAPAAQPEGAVPGIMVVSPSGQETDVPPPLKAPAAGAAVPGAALDERRRVYGENALPTRKPKTLLQLMWLALQDKVLVRACMLRVWRRR